MLFSFFNITTIYSQRGSRIPGPVQGSFIKPSLILNPSLSNCQVNGVTITSTGTTIATYFPPPMASNCIPMDVVNDVPWTGGMNNSGIVTYTFSQPIISATIGYSAIDFNDVGAITINGSSPVLLTNPCNVAILNTNTIGGLNIPTIPFIDVNITVSSATPFTSITLTNVGGQTGWVSGNLCNFTFILPTSNNVIVVDPKYSYTGCVSTMGNVVPSILTNVSGSGNPITVGGQPANSSNVTIIPVVPTAPFPAGMSINQSPIQPMPSYLTFNPNGNGTINIANSALPFFQVEFYFILIPTFGGTPSIPIRYNITRSSTCRIANTNKNITVKSNPSKDFFDIVFDNEQEATQLELYNNFGIRCLQTQINNTNEYKIDAQNLPKGIYFLKIITKDTTINKQLIKI